MRKLRTLMLGGVMAFAALALTVAPTAAAINYTLFGDAKIVQPGNGSANALELKSDTSTVDQFGSARFDVPGGTTFADLTTLSTDFNVTDDNCGLGSPRFSVKVDQGGTNKNIFAYLGGAPNYNACAQNTWTNSGDLLETGQLVDTSQVGGTFYDTYDNALNNYGSLTVVSVSLVVDAGYSFGDGEQTILFDNVAINQALEDFEPEATVAVTIDKYIDGAKATATTANNAAFPMESSWDAENIGAGTGNYALSPSGYNSQNAYEAITSDMSLGADYSTHELTNGSVVAENCTLNGAPFALVGYKTGDTLAEAEAATPSTTAPSFTDLQNNKFVIVLNKTCTTPTTKDQCKKNGWASYGYFKNQGDCVSWVSTSGRNKPAFSF